MEKGYFIMDRAQTTPNINDNARNNYIPPQTVSNKPQSLPISQQPPSYTNDYLTPCSPSPTGKTHAQPPQPPALPAGGFNRSPTESSVKSREGGEQLLPRADSGIEADFKPSSSANPRSSTIYESIDAAGNFYTEPSPHTFHRGRSAGGETSSSGVSSLYPAATVPSAASDSEDAGLDDNVRHRLHPEYNTLKQSNPQLYSETSLCSKPDYKGTGRHFSPRHSRLRYLWCGLVVLTFITLLLLAIITYVFVLLIPGMQARIRIQENDMKQMRLDYQNLTQRVDALHLFSTANPTVSPQASGAEGVEDVALTVRELNASVHEFDSRLQQLNDRFQLQINNISHVPDMTRVSGVGNLSACFHHGSRTVQALPGPPSTTSWMPPLGSDQFRNNMVMSVTCGVQGGTLHLVETKPVPSSPGQRQYRCHCEGNVRGYDRRTCHIYMVLCPRLLPLHLSAVPPV